MNHHHVNVFQCGSIHGDMVHSFLKHCAVSLGGTDSMVPIQAAAYFLHLEECNEEESEIQVSKIDGMQAKTRDNRTHLHSKVIHSMPLM